MTYAIYLCGILVVAWGLFLWLRRVRRLNPLYLRQREAQFSASFGDEALDNPDSDRVCEFLIRRK